MADAPNPDLKYDFMPWARRGLARAHTHAQLGMAGISALPQVSMGLKLKGTGGSEMTATPTVDLKLYGPADVIGIDPRIVVRTEPRANNHDFEPNYLAAIEFDPPDFPWLFTPAKADPNQRLTPWLTLVVFSRREVSPPVLRPGRLLPSVLLPTNTPLPALDEAWMWAHAQVLRDAAGQQVIDMLRNAPAKNLSRLVCPRRLEADTSYMACLVPTFKPGLDAALGRPPAADAKLTPAWSGTAASADFELPIYYHWEFSTGPAGDFETLARRLKAPAEYPPGIQDQLDRLGRLPVEVDADHLLQPHAARSNPDPDYVSDNYLAQYEGALLSLSISGSPEPGKDDEIAADLQTVLNAAEPLAQGTLGLDEQPIRIPVVGPPIYGAWHARRHTIDAGKRHRWQDGLNASVPRRMAASVGTRLVQSNQEEFMRAAWRQVGDVLRVERLFSLLHLSKKALTGLTRRFDRLPEARRLALLSPAAARIRLHDSLTIHGYSRTTSLPDGFADGALRRALSPARKLLRTGAGAAATDHLTELAAGFQTKGAAKMFAQPERFRIDGLVGLKALDSVKLPGGAAAMVDIPGLGDGLRVSDVRTFMKQAKDTAGLLRRGGWTDAGVSARLKAGVLTDGHYARIDEFNAALADRGAGQAIAPAAIAATLAGTRSLKAEGILLSASQLGEGAPVLASRGLKVDARGGQLLDMSPQTTRGGRVGATLFPGTVGLVNVEAIRRYGNKALFNSLPANTVGTAAPGAAPISIGSSGGGNFVGTGGQDIAADALSITVSPPLAGAVALNRFKTAWRDKLARDKVPAPPKGVSVEIVPFNTVGTARTAVSALNPEVMVTRRVESLLQLGSAEFGIDKASPGVIGQVLKHNERFVIPKAYDRVMAYPRIDEPLYRRLVTMDKSAFMPGVEEIPNDTILLVKTNPKFVESFMVGSNHEMGRELLWRGYPTDQRGTPFGRFWQYFDANRMDIQPIHKWNVNDPLGMAGTPTPGDNGEGRLALLIRGQLLRRYPNTHIYAIRKDTPTPDFASPGKFVSPEGAGMIGNDIVFFLFPIAASQANQHWFVLEEPMTEPRFGFDDEEITRQVARVRRRGGKIVKVGQESPVSETLRTKVNALRVQQGEAPLPPAEDGDTWLDVDWAEVGTARGGHVTLARLAQVNLSNNALELNVAGSHAGEIARALLQRPFRGYFDGNRLS